MTGKRTNQRIAFWIFRILGLIVVGILFWILGFIIWHGAGVINWKFLTTAPTDGMTGGGIFPAIVGTFCLIAGSMVVAFPLGVMSAIKQSKANRAKPFGCFNHNTPATEKSSASSAS